MSRETSHNKDENLEEALKTVRKLIGEIQYGSVTLVIQDGVVVQVERQEKIRLK